MKMLVAQDLSELFELKQLIKIFLFIFFKILGNVWLNMGNKNSLTYRYKWPFFRIFWTYPPFSSHYWIRYLRFQYSRSIERMYAEAGTDYNLSMYHANTEVHLYSACSVHFHKNNRTFCTHCEIYEREKAILLRHGAGAIMPTSTICCDCSSLLHLNSLKNR